MKPELIIFDCDGTLADTEYTHQLAVIEALEICGFPGYDVPFCLKYFVGRGMSTVQQIVEEKEGRRIPPEFLQLYINLCDSHMASGVLPLTGAVEAVNELSKNYKICVASNGEPHTVAHTIQSIGAMDMFGREYIYTKSQVARGKPFPDLFLFAADQMCVPPERCMVVEDSIAGVTAGLAAGMTTVGITAVSHDPAQTHEDMKKAGVAHIFRSWPEIITFIEGL